MDDCDVYNLALLFDVSFQILSSTTSVQVINIQGMTGMIIGHDNSTRVKHFVGTKLLQNTGNLSSAVTHNTMEVPASQQNVTQSKRRKVNVPPDPAVLFDTWPMESPRKWRKFTLVILVLGFLRARLLRLCCTAVFPPIFLQLRKGPL